MTVQPTLKRQNTDDSEAQPKSMKRPKPSANNENMKEEDDDSAEENRLAWIQQQLNALQENATQSY